MQFVSRGVLVVSIFVSYSSFGAVDMFLKIANIPGDSTDKTHAKEVDVLAWSWGAGNPSSIGPGGNTAGKPSFQNFSYTSYLDSSHAPLLVALAAGKHIPSVVLTVRTAGAAPVDYLRIGMTNVFVTSLSTGGSGGEDRLTQNVSLSFSQIGVTYYPQTPSGSQGNGIVFTWDLEKGTP